jgi:hypothetical protein
MFHLPKVSGLPNSITMACDLQGPLETFQLPSYHNTVSSPLCSPVSYSAKTGWLFITISKTELILESLLCCRVPNWCEPQIKFPIIIHKTNSQSMSPLDIASDKALLLWLKWQLQTVKQLIPRTKQFDSHYPCLFCAMGCQWWRLGASCGHKMEQFSFPSLTYFLPFLLHML